MSKQVEVRTDKDTKWSPKLNTLGDRQDSQALSPRSLRLLDNHRQCLTELGYPLSEVVSLVRKYHDDEQTLTQHVSRLIDEAIEHPWRVINPKTSKASIAQAAPSERIATNRRSMVRSMDKAAEAKKPRERKSPQENTQRSELAQRRGMNKRGNGEKRIPQREGEAANPSQQPVDASSEQKMNTSTTREDRRKPLRRDIAKKFGEKAVYESQSTSKTFKPKKEVPSDGKAATSKSAERARQDVQSNGVPSQPVKGAWGRRRLVQNPTGSSDAKATSVTAGIENLEEVSTTTTLRHPAPSTLASRPGMKCWAKVVSGAPEDATKLSVVAESNDAGDASEQAISQPNETVSSAIEAEVIVPQAGDNQQDDDTFLPSSTVSFNFATVTAQPTKYTSVRTAPTEIPPVSSPVKVTDEVDTSGPVTIIERAVDKHIVIKHRPADVPKIDRRSLQQSRVPLQGINGVDTMGATGSSVSLDHGIANRQEVPHQGAALPNRENAVDYIPGRVEPPYHHLPANVVPDELYYPPAGMYPSRMPPYGYDYHDYVPYPYRPPTARGFNTEYSGDSITYPPPHIMQSYQKPPPMNTVRPYQYENGYNAHSGPVQHPHPGMYSVGSHGQSQLQPVSTEQHIPAAATTSEQFSTLPPPIGLPPLFLQAAPPAMMHGRTGAPMENVNSRMEYRQPPYKY